jgi:Ca-activated chloride channel family protein
MVPDEQETRCPITNPRILIQPLKPAVIAGVAQKLPVLIRVQAPDAAPTREEGAQALPPRPGHRPFRLDVRAAAGRSRALRQAHHRPARAHRHRPRWSSSTTACRPSFRPSPVGDRQALHLALSQIHSGGSTNLHGGWQAGAPMACCRPPAEAALARVILLSDGNANVGEITDTTAIAALCAQAAERGVTTSTYGLGRDFNEDLMVEMAKRGGGNHYYGDTAADLFEPFAEEFDFISALCARHVRLSLAAPPGVTHPPAQRLSGRRRCGIFR